MENYNVHLDWLSFTYKPDKNKINKDYLPLDAFKDAFPELEPVFISMEVGSKGLNYYNTSFRFNDNFIICTNMLKYDEESLTENMVNMGVHFICPAHSLELLYDLFGIDMDGMNNLRELFLLLKNRGCIISRVDIALDDFDKKYKALDYCKFWTNGRIVSRMRKANLIMNSEGSGKGSTFYLGSRATGKLLRIYDKDIESEGELDCLRHEVELHGDYAKDFAQYIIENDDFNFFDYLKNDWFYVVQENNNYTNTSQVPKDLVWFDYMRESEISRYGTSVTIPRYTAKQRTKSIDRWIEYSVLPSLVGYCKLHGVRYLLKNIFGSEKVADKYRLYMDSLDFEWESKYQSVIDK